MKVAIIAFISLAFQRLKFDPPLPLREIKNPILFSEIRTTKYLLRNEAKNTGG